MTDVGPPPCAMTNVRGMRNLRNKMTRGYLCASCRFAQLRRGGSDDDDWCLAGHAAIEVDHILIDHAHAAGRHGLADGPPLRRSMNPVTGVLIVSVEIECARTERVIEPAGLTAAPFLQFRLADDHLRGRGPCRPFLAVLDVRAALPAKAVTPDPHAIAYG